MYIVGVDLVGYVNLETFFSFIIITSLKYIAPSLRLVSGALSVPLLMSMSEAFSVPFYTLIKLCYTKALEWSSLFPGHPKTKSFSLEITNLTSFTKVFNFYHSTRGLLYSSTIQKLYRNTHTHTHTRDFPSGSVVKNLLLNAGDVGSIPELGRSLGVGNNNPLQYSCLENSKNRVIWWLSSMGSQRVGHDWACILNICGLGERTYACQMKKEGSWAPDILEQL